MHTVPCPIGTLYLWKRSKERCQSPVQMIKVGKLRENQPGAKIPYPRPLPLSWRTSCRLRSNLASLSYHCCVHVVTADDHKRNRRVPDGGYVRPRPTRIARNTVMMPNASVVVSMLRMVRRKTMSARCTDILLRSCTASFIQIFFISQIRKVDFLGGWDLVDRDRSCIIVRHRSSSFSIIED